MSKKIISILLLIAAILAIILVITSKNNGYSENKHTGNQQEEYYDNSEKTILDEIEEELSGNNQKEEPSGPIEISITGPEGDSFSPGQARMWKAEIKNFQTEYTKLANCSWEFYLNENNEEYLYKTQETSAVLGSNTSEICAFTSTSIATRGDLRAKLILEIKDNDGNITETYEAERSYKVQ